MVSHPMHREQIVVQPHSFHAGKVSSSAIDEETCATGRWLFQSYVGSTFCGHGFIECVSLVSVDSMRRAVSNPRSTTRCWCWEEGVPALP
ncbi:hypothetical protein AGIG_G1291 [Arapaima gigas]